MTIFIIYMTVIVAVLAMIVSKKFRAFVLAVILFACFVYGAFALQNVAMAEEERTCILVGFDLSKGLFVLKDEDGFLWEFYLEKENYTIGDEYTLHLPTDEEPWCEKVKEEVK